VKTTRLTGRLKRVKETYVCIKLVQVSPSGSCSYRLLTHLSQRAKFRGHPFSQRARYMW